MDLDLLRHLDAYLDAAPRSSCRAEEVGPFTLFVDQAGGWPYYARPTPGARSIVASAVDAVRERQRELEVLEAFEWVAELAPYLAEAAAIAGLHVVWLPLMHLEPEDFRPTPPPDGAWIRIVTPADDIATTHAVAMVSFAHPGTDVGQVADEELTEVAAGGKPSQLAAMRERIVEGVTVTALAEVDGRAVAVGSHIPVGGATEIVGVGTLPALRRRGLGAAVTSVLVEDALSRGISDVLLSAGDDAVARVYARLGFRVVGTAGAAEPPGP